MIRNLIAQPHTWTCWAASLAMLLNAHQVGRRGSGAWTAESVASALGPHYQELFRQGLGIQGDESTLRELASTWGFGFACRQSNPSMADWQTKLAVGPVLVVKRYIGGAPFHHAVVASHVEGGHLVVYDPAPPQVGTIIRDGREFLGSFLGFIEGPSPYAGTA